MSCARETTLIFFVMYFWLTFFQLYVNFIFQWIAFIFGRDEEEDQ